MEVMFERVAGLDVGKASVTVCVRTPGTRAGRRLNSAALIADGAHARADALVSAAVIVTAGAVALGATVADPLIGLAITIAILRITWHSWETVRGEVFSHKHAN